MIRRNGCGAQAPNGCWPGTQTCRAGWADPPRTGSLSPPVVCLAVPVVVFRYRRHPSDVELLAAKSKGLHYITWARMPRPSRRVAASAESMGWVAEWVYRVSTTALATVCMTRQTSLDEITLDDLAVVRADIAAAVAVLPRCRATQRGLLHSLHTVCYQLGVVDEPPEHGNARHTSLEQRMVPSRSSARGSFATCASSRRPCGLRRLSPAPPAWPCSGPGSASIILRSAL